MEYNNMNNNPMEKEGWEIVKTLNAELVEIGTSMSKPGISVIARKLLAQYFGLGTSKPSRLHSAILSCAVKMAVYFPDFHFVPFLEMWGIENIRPEDSETRRTEDGKCFPSLAERMVKAYVYSLLFHPDESLSLEEERAMMPIIQKKGYKVHEKDNRMIVSTQAVAMKVFEADVRNRKMTFVALLLPDGSEIVTEVHTITQYQKMRYADIQNQIFRLILRTSDKGNVRVEAAYSCKGGADDFDTAIGYIEHVDASHKHIHVFDNGSRHFVHPYVNFPSFREGQIVRFIPIVPKDSKFKTAIITDALEDGFEVFGFRNAVVTYVNEEQGYFAWELLPDEDGQVRPFIELGVTEFQEPGRKGYINKRLCESLGRSMPKNGDKLQIIAFLKRGKDKIKRPYVVYYK